MPHVARTVGIIQPTGPTQVLLAAWSQGRVVQPTKIGMKEAVECVGVGNGLPADAPDLVTGVDQKLDCGQAYGGREARVQASSISHDLSKNHVALDHAYCVHSK